MELEISGMKNFGPVLDQNRKIYASEQEKALRKLHVQQEQQRKKQLQLAQQQKAKKEGAAQYLQDILHFSYMFNRKLKYSIDTKQDQIIVKVIDSETDKVIKELPPEALQRLHIRMKEAIGLLIDEEI